MLWALAGTLICAATGATSGTTDSTDAPLATVVVFQRNEVFFLPGDTVRPSLPGVEVEDHGRVLVRGVALPDRLDPVRIVAHVRLEPVPKDEQSVCDPWDRAGDIRLARPGQPDLEVAKFVTAYGGATEFTVDVSQLAPLLRGECTFKAFIDTWLYPAWRISFTLDFFALPAGTESPAWAAPVAFAQEVTRAQADSGGVVAAIEIPPGLRRVRLYYFVSGHCTDGRDADEFESKDNVLYADGRVVYRFRPWRDDCRTFRARNPYCRRWSDGTWSCDYDRSGWCPGDLVSPLVLDLSDALTPGGHTLTFQIEKIRPRGADGAYGYWRVSAYVIGYR